MFLEIAQNLQEKLCARVSFKTKLQTSACNFIEKENLAHDFPVSFENFFENNFSTEHLWTTASVIVTQAQLLSISQGQIVCRQLERR